MDQCKDVYFCASGEWGDEDSGDVLPPAYTQTPHLEATLAASDIDRFGEWTILMASSATKDLLQLRRRDAKMTECVLKRIRQLSRGNFSGNNLRALHRPSHGIPIYQAEVLSNLRLVVRLFPVKNPGEANEDVTKYQIDCALDDNGQVRGLSLWK